MLWRLFRYWFAGNAACKIFAFMRAFGFYLSSMVLITVSLDRYIAIVHPLKANSAFSRRGYVMLVVAWALAGLCSIPQTVMWSTRPDPDRPDREQCVTFGSNPQAVKAFTIFFLTTVYFIPLFIMVFAYSRILLTIIRKANVNESRTPRTHQGCHLSCQCQQVVRSDEGAQYFELDPASRDHATLNGILMATGATPARGLNLRTPSMSFRGTNSLAPPTGMRWSSRCTSLTTTGNSRSNGSSNGPRHSAGSIFANTTVM